MLRGVLQTGSTARWDSTIRPRDKGPFSTTILVVLDPPLHILLLLQLPNLPLPAPITIDQIVRDASPSAEA